jgi:ABC-type transporter Mla maintaining outer membrane lipid asymmetry ATPase subunit MlaF
MSEPVLEVRQLQKQYGALRPLRLQELRVDRNTIVALIGLDAAAAEVFVNLVTGATLPDTGEVQVFGLATAAITDGDEWLRTLDRFGILSDRAALLEDLTVAQNLAMTFTLDIDPIDPDVGSRVDALASDVGLEPEWRDRPARELDAAGKLRVRLGRALALAPDLLVLEHPTATLRREDVEAFAGLLRRLAAAHGFAAVAVTADEEFAAAVTRHVLRLRPADGALLPADDRWGLVKRLFR